MPPTDNETTLEELELDITDPFGDESSPMMTAGGSVPIPQPTPIPFGENAGN